MDIHHLYSDDKLYPDEHSIYIWVQTQCGWRRSESMNLHQLYWWRKDGHV